MGDGTALADGSGVVWTCGVGEATTCAPGEQAIAMTASASSGAMPRIIEQYAGFSTVLAKK